METNTNAKVYDSKTGELIGSADIDVARYENACNNPEGHVMAGDVLKDADIQRLGITTTMNITLPTIHLNGTGAKTIFEENVNAMHAIGDALAVIEKMEFNARDYYPQGPEAYTAARAERNTHVEALRQAKEHFMAIAIHAQEFIKD